MKISERTISAIGKLITGTPYRSGPELVKYFNELGSNDVYGQGFPSRGKYAEDKLRELNGTSGIAKAIEYLLDPRNFIDNPDLLNNSVATLNTYLKYDGYELVQKGDIFKVTSLQDALVEPETVAAIDHDFIQAQLEKCDQKFKGGDYDGAITNARTLVEAILIEIEEKLTGEKKKYDGDILKLYKKTQKLLDLDPARKDIEDVQKQIISGLSSIVSGIAGLRNKMGDAHATGNNPLKHHAKLAINSANTLVEFLFDVYEEQVKVK
jgi:hypothetical protein